MLARSSKRALISTTTTTCLPASAASMSASTIGDCPLARYSVCLIASTPGAPGGLLNEPFDRRSERVVGVLDEDVAFGHGGEDAGILRDLPGGRDERRVAQLSDVEVRYGGEPAQVERSRHPVHRARVDVELGD